MRANDFSMCPTDSMSVRSVEGDSPLSPISSDVGSFDYEISEFTPERVMVAAHACSYCGIDSPKCVVQCTTCNKWFCNSKLVNSTAGSHIVTHLVMLRHCQVRLHSDLDLGDETLECYSCGNKNVFLLGYVQAKQELVVVLLCRLPCAQQKDMNWDVMLWLALIDNRHFLPWVATSELSPDEEIGRNLITPKQIQRLEAQWRLNREATIDDLEKTTVTDEDVLPILMRYNDAFQYQRLFAPLVNLEAEHDKNLKESQVLEHISVEWSLGLNQRHLASFALLTFETHSLKVAVGDEIILRYNGGGGETWEGQGYIVRLPNAHKEMFTLELNRRAIDPPTQNVTGFTAEFVWKGTSYDRMQEAMKTFALEKESVLAYIYHKLMGHEVDSVEFDVRIPKNLSIPNFTVLNQSQLEAVRSVLTRPLSLIQGPPGTGKTVTSSTIVYHLSKMNKDKILVCAPSNIVVDHLAANLGKLGLKVVRLTARLREDVESLVLDLALHNLVRKNGDRNLRRLLLEKERTGELDEKDSRELMRLIRTTESKLLKGCDVVCCTCVGAGDKRLSLFKFRSVLIDELTQALEPEVLIPIVKGAKQVVLVGDHQQLGPVILDKKAGDAGLRQSLFERLVVLGHVPIRLEVQYRMNPCLSEFPSNMFYEGSLQDGVSKRQRLVATTSFPWPVKLLPMMFWANYGREEISGTGSSFLNRVEAMNVEKVITRLFKDGVKPHQIGVVTPYEGQRAYIVQYMQSYTQLPEMREQYMEVEVASVDAFQGREKDYIILSCVRANDQQVIGFLSDPRRLNVALTRAKFGLVIVGNPRALCRNTLWNHVLVHFREKGCLVDGPLDHLQLLMVQLNVANPRGNSNWGVGGRPRFGAQLTMQGTNTDFDLALVVSFMPSTTAEAHQRPAETNWPQLPTKPGVMPLTSNYLSRLEAQTPFAHHDIDDIKLITLSFAAGLNI